MYSARYDVEDMSKKLSPRSFHTKTTLDRRNSNLQPLKGNTTTTTITITTITILRAVEEVKTWSVPERALFFLIRYCQGLTDCSRTDPSGSRSIFLVPKHEKGPLATRYIVVQSLYIYTYIFLVHAITVLPNSRVYIHLYMCTNNVWWSRSFASLEKFTCKSLLQQQQQNMFNIELHNVYTNTRILQVYAYMHDNHMLLRRQFFIQSMLKTSI